MSFSCTGAGLSCRSIPCLCLKKRTITKKKEHRTMEGTKCCHHGCSVYDYLPFHCPKCERTYCLEHRSRFVHDCIPSEEEKEEDHTKGSSSPVPSGGGIKGMFQAISDRFKGESSSSPVPSASHSHYNVHSSKKGRGDGSVDSSSGFHSNVAKLDHLSSSEASNEKTRSISKQTKKMLIKSKAKGNDNTLMEDRFYFILHFDEIPSTGKETSTNKTKTSSHSSSSSSHGKKGLSFSFSFFSISFPSSFSRFFLFYSGSCSLCLLS
jgi:hypothetical protein